MPRVQQTQTIKNGSRISCMRALLLGGLGTKWPRLEARGREQLETRLGGRAQWLTQDLKGLVEECGVLSRDKGRLPRLGG